MSNQYTPTLNLPNIFCCEIHNTKFNWKFSDSWGMKHAGRWTDTFNFCCFVKITQKNLNKLIKASTMGVNTTLLHKNVEGKIWGTYLLIMPCSEQFLNLKKTVYWYVVLCNLVEVYWCCRGAFFLHHQDDDGSLMLEAACTSITSINRLHGTAFQNMT
jgi:hypothetical protein